MLNLFREGSLAHKAGTIIYNLFMLNLLWVVFSLPLITIGASTTAMFFIAGKIVHKEKFSLFHDFWRSFKNNFKQATIILLILALFIYIVITNVNILLNYFTLEYSSIVLILQYIVMFEVLGISIMIFPLLSRYHVNIFHAFKLSFYITNRHLLTTIPCVAVLPAMYLMISKMPFTILFAGGIYSLWITYFVSSKFALYQEES